MRRRRSGLPRKPEWAGKHWDVVLFDGNGDSFVSIMPETTLGGPIMNCRGNITPEMEEDITRTLRLALEFWEGQRSKRPPGGSATVHVLKPRDR